MQDCRNSYYGGAIYNSGDMTLTDAIITHSQADFGGAICNTSVLTISGGSFTNNYAYEGGAIYGSEYSQIIIKNCPEINYNKAYTGGGIFAGNKITIPNQDGITITYNEAEDDGGGIYVAYGADVSLLGSAPGAPGVVRIENNIARYDGGGVYIDPNAKLTLNNAFIVLNQAGSLGSGMYVAGTYVKVNFVYVMMNEIYYN